MKLIKQLFYILLFTILGDIISRWLPIPGSVIGLILLYLALQFKIVTIDDIKDVGNWLKDNMSFLFVPISVGLMNSFGILKTSWFPLTTIMIVTTLGTMIGVALITEWYINKGGH